MRNLKRADPETGIVAEMTVRAAYASNLIDGQLVQYGPGRDEGLIAGRRIGDARLLRVRFAPKALLKTAQQQEFANFTVPFQPSVEWSINGRRLDRDTFFINLFSDENELLAANRNTYCGRVPLAPFLAALRSLQGRDLPDRSGLTELCRLPPRAYRQLVGALHRHFDRRCHPGTDQTVLQQSLTDLLAGAVARSSLADDPAASSLRNKAALVRKARDIVAARDPGTVSMAALCRETGVSAPTLIAAFRDMTGRTPSQFFTLKRLARARDAIAASRDPRAAVKAAALGQGFSDLSRFGALFRKTYGELPSQMLRRMS